MMLLRDSLPVVKIATDWLDKFCHLASLNQMLSPKEIEELKEMLKYAEAYYTCLPPPDAIITSHRLQQLWRERFSVLIRVSPLKLLHRERISSSHLINHNVFCILLFSISIGSVRRKPLALSRPPPGILIPPFFEHT